MEVIRTSAWVLISLDSLRKPVVEFPVFTHVFSRAVYDMWFELIRVTVVPTGRRLFYHYGTCSMISCHTLVKHLACVPADERPETVLSSGRRMTLL